MSDTEGWQARCQPGLHLISQQAIPPFIILQLAAVPGTACLHLRIRRLERRWQRRT